MNMCIQYYYTLYPSKYSHLTQWGSLESETVGIISPQPSVAKRILDIHLYSNGIGGVRIEASKICSVFGDINILAVEITIISTSNLVHYHPQLNHSFRYIRQL